MELEPIYKTLGSIIRQRRRRLELPQAAVAARLGISRATLANIEVGRQRVLVHQLYAIAEALGLRTIDLLPPTRRGFVTDWANLPIQGDLNQRQKEQIAIVIGAVSRTSSETKDKVDGKPAKRIDRKPR